MLIIRKDEYKIMAISGQEVYKELEGLEEKDFKRFIISAQTDKEHDFWVQAQDYFCGGKHYPRTIYHYTNFSALEGILSDEGIRMYRSDGMNDKAEMRNFIDLVEKSLYKRIRQKDMRTVIAKRFAEERTNRKQDISYLASFSTWPDDVSQWERYGNNGYGVTVAFDFASLKAIARKNGIMLQEVFYGDNADRHQLVDVLEDLFYGRDHVRHNFKKDNWKGIFDNAWAVSVAHKHYTFASEQEFRLVTLPTWRGNRYDILGDAYTVSTPSVIKECINLNWKKECRDSHIPIDKMVTGIIIGPRSGMTIVNLQEWLKQIGMECLAKRVRKSKSTLR